MNTARILKFGARTASVVLGIIFLLAAFSKIGDLPAFQKSIQDAGFLPQWIEGVAVLLVPGLELALGVCLFTRLSPKETAILAMGLLLVFLGLGIYSNLIGHTSGCDCFKIRTPTWLQLTGWWIVARNFVFLALGAVVFLEASRKNISIGSGCARV